MTVHLYFNGDEGQSEAQIRLDSESHLDTYVIAQLSKRIPKAIRVSGSIMRDGAYLWINIPLKKYRWNALSLNNKKEVKP
jgi:hypothetical protein